MGDKVLVTLITDKYSSKSGLELPKKEIRNTGIIKQIGTGPVVNQLREGQKVIFAERSAIETEYGFVVKGSDLIAIMD